MTKRQENWRGLSLSFIRQVAGLEPRYPSVVDAHKDTTIFPIEKGTVPPPGAFIWFRNSGPWDIGLSLGAGKMLCISLMTGRPIIESIVHGLSEHGELVGFSWTIGAAKLK